VQMVADEVFCWLPTMSPAGASRCYECPIQTLDVCFQSLEQQDALCFTNEYSDEVWV
jgi:hypothetical protein